jgi:predicted DNA-binding helix-hairpin-helix protein
MDALSKLRILSGYAAEEQEGDPTLTACGMDPLPRVEEKMREKGWVVFHAQMGGGKTMPLLKTMLTSVCENDCNYCVFRKQRDFQRVSFSPDEMAATFMDAIRRGVVRGLFLSSGLAGTGKQSQDRLIKTVEIIRLKYHFGGYIHLKIMPGAEEAQIERAMQLSTRVSINLEGPNPSRLLTLAPRKDFTGDLFPRVGMMSSYRRSQQENDPHGRPTSLTTQMVVGAAGETDLELLAVSEVLYARHDLARVYYSRFNPNPDTPLGNLPATPQIRTTRLYQASFLLRDYGFAMEEMPFEGSGNLPVGVDPKIAWARENLASAPVEVNKAEPEQLLRIPGVGRIGAEKIVSARRIHGLNSLKQLGALGIAAGRAAPFVLLNGIRPEVQLELPAC